MYIMAVKQGALPIQIIRELIKVRAIVNAQDGNVKPSSLDLTVSDEAYEVSGIFLPRRRELVEDLVSHNSKRKVSLKEPLEVGKHYIVRLEEKLRLPSMVYAFCNPKSTSGRIDVHVRLIADGVSRFDTIPNGYKGALWAVVSPKSFPVQLYSGVSLNQLRFFTHDTRLSPLEIRLALSNDKLLWSPEGKSYGVEDLHIWDNDGSLVLTLDLEGPIVGYEGKHTEAVLDTSKIGHYPASHFFKPLRNTSGTLTLKSGAFYILTTHEYVRVPPHLACEMVPMDERSGEFRSHYAGFIDPGWGWGEDGEGKGRPLTLEVRPFEDIVVRHGQPIGKIMFEKLTDYPDTSYDAIDSNYLDQATARLAKYFKK